MKYIIIGIILITIGLIWLIKDILISHKKGEVGGSSYETNSASPLSNKLNIVKE